ncbi:hypothetical protein ACFX1S_034953 [Malus domestica]
MSSAQASWCARRRCGEARFREDIRRIHRRLRLQRCALPAQKDRRPSHVSVQWRQAKGLRHCFSNDTDRFDWSRQHTASQCVMWVEKVPGEKTI